MRIGIPSLALAASFIVAIIAVLTFSRPPVTVVQEGYRGTGQQLLFTPTQVANALGNNVVPPMLPAINGGPLAGTVYKNVQVLKYVSTGAFTRLMVSMTNWVAPARGCGFCHVAGNFASDALYTKVVARRMLQMTIATNVTYANHVGPVGVTCYTCHRGNAVPANVWFSGPTPGSSHGLAEVNMGKNLPAAAANYSSLPSDPFTPFLLNNENIRVSGQTALPSGNRQSIKQTDWTYALMMHYSQALGVNCEFCHNSRAFNDWSQSSPQRVKAFYAEAMLRDLNSNYMVPLTQIFPVSLRGAQGDVAKANCATCHQGAYKPLLGAPMAQYFPELEGKGTVASISAPAAPSGGGVNGGSMLGNPP
jgi:photosynthetic reaction center cytochrome c subunit